MLPRLDAVIVEDYGKGVLAQEFTAEICRLVRGAGKILAADPNPHNPLDWKHVTVIKPNRAEAFASAGIPLSEPHDDPVQDTALLKVGNLLMEKWDTENLLVTLGEQGVLLFRRGESPYHAPTRAREVFDVSGAGDTVIALFTLGLCAGATPAEAAEIANHSSARRPFVRRSCSRASRTEARNCRGSRRLGSARAPRAVRGAPAGQRSSGTELLTVPRRRETRIFGEGAENNTRGRVRYPIARRSDNSFANCPLPRCPASAQCPGARSAPANSAL